MYRRWLLPLVQQFPRSGIVVFPWTLFLSNCAIWGLRFEVFNVVLVLCLCFSELVRNLRMSKVTSQVSNLMCGVTLVHGLPHGYFEGEKCKDEFGLIGALSQF